MESKPLTKQAKKPAKSTKSSDFVRTLGPVSDLERHLPAEWWSSLFNALYLKTDGDVVENSRNTEFEVDLLIQTVNLKPSHHVLDLCCGQGRHVLELARRGFKNVHGIDRSRYLIRLARKRASNLGGSVQFSEGDARKLRIPANSKDCVFLMGNSFGYFEKQEDDIAVLRGVMQILKSQGKLALDIVDGTWMKENFEPRSWEWIDQKYFVNRERTLSADKKRIITREIITDSNVGIIADQFYAERLYTLDEITNHLTDIGFLNVEKICEITPDSERNQDMGMMAQRLFICCEAPDKKIKTQPKTSHKPVTVILGDPRLPDSVKRGGVYNKEDKETVEKLKHALAELPEYQVNYFDNHTSLVQTLCSDPPKFVFNLCDEGLKNQATMELHIPALLEILGVPYSGAAPGCLALCYDKQKVNTIAASMDIPVPLETICQSMDQVATIPDVFPALLKPACGDGSVGITQQSVVTNKEELIKYLHCLKKDFVKTPIIIQEFLAGTEYTVGLIGNDNHLEALPILEVDYSELPKGLPKILSYESKWHPDSPYWNHIHYRAADLTQALQHTLIDYSKLLFDRLNCRDYARFDFRCDLAGVPKLLEVNPNPGWCWDGKLNKMVALMGYSYGALLNAILKAALERYGMNN